MTVSVAFMPSAAQAYSGYLIFNRSNGATITVSLSGIGTSAVSSSASAVTNSIVVNPSALSFSVQAGGAATSQSVNINDSALTPLSFSVSADQSWITLSATSGTTQSTGVALQFGVNPAGISAGSYSGHVILTASGAANSPVSIPVTLTVAPPAAVAPSITSQPANAKIIAGQTATFNVAATGTTPMTYQWNKNGAAISGATSSSYTTPAETTADNNAQFTVTLSNGAGNVTSNPATLTVNAATQILNSSSSSLSFGSVNLSSSSSQNVTLTNAGNSSIAISNVTVTGAGFNASGVSAGLILAPGQTATLTATFAPSASGSVTGSVSVASNATNSPDSISLSGTGVAVVNHSVDLTWSPSISTSIKGYNTYSSAKSGGPYTKLTSTPVATTGYTDTTVQAGLTYYYVVTSVNTSNVESAYSSEVSATIP